MVDMTIKDNGVVFCHFWFADKLQSTLPSPQCSDQFQATTQKIE